MPEPTSDNTSTTKTLISVDAVPAKALLAGKTDKGSFSSRTPDTSASLHGCKPAESHQQFHPNTSAEKKYEGDPILPPSELTHSYVVPEVIRPLDSYPRGYPRMAACFYCDANFSSYRKYGWLHNRVLLHFQAELARLEDELQHIDDAQAGRVLFKEHKGLWCDDFDKSRRKDVLAEIKTKLAEYDDLVFRLEKKNAMKRPTTTNKNSVMQLACRSVVLSEAKWTFRMDDLVALADDAATQPWFTFIFRYATMFAPRLVTGIFRSREQRIKTSSLHHVVLLSPIRIDAIYRAILTMVGTAIVLGPISAPSLLSRNPILTIYASTIGFSIFCAIFTKASRDPVFVATGGYCALQVMVMLLGSPMKGV